MAYYYKFVEKNKTTSFDNPQDCAIYACNNQKKFPYGEMITNNPETNKTWVHFKYQKEDKYE